MSKICSNFAVENEFLACQNRVTNSHKILILNKIIADLQQVMKITSTMGLSGFESWLSNKKRDLTGLFLVYIFVLSVLPRVHFSFGRILRHKPQANWL